MDEVQALTLAWAMTIITVAAALVVLPPVFDTIGDAVMWLRRRIK